MENKGSALGDSEGLSENTPRTPIRMHHRDTKGDGQQGALPGRAVAAPPSRKAMS